MAIGLSHVLLSSIFFSLGYYVKARFEINQGEEIIKLKEMNEKLKTDYDKFSQNLGNQLRQAENERERAITELQELLEHIKEKRFLEIAKVANISDPAFKALKNFL